MIFSGHQPNFVPYLGVFYKMYRSDVFVLDDDVKYSSTGLHNKNYICANGEKSSIIVPVSVKADGQIRDARISYQSDWQRKMLKTLRLNYGKTDCFDDVYPVVEKHIINNYEFLVDLNIALIKEIAERLGITCRFVVSGTEIPTDLKKNERNVYQCKNLGCDTYYSGIGGKDYNDEELFAANGIEIVYSDFEPTEYKQRRPYGKPFRECLSILDYLFNNGWNLLQWWEGNRG